MRPSIVVLTFLIATSIFCFFAAEASAQETDAKTYELRGKVVNAITGEPVAGALLRVSAAGRSAAQFSGSDGRFDFADMPGGQYPIWVRKPGFFSAQELNSFNAAQDLTNVPGEDAIVKLYPEGIIYGEVKGENGEPVEGMQVKAERWQVDNGRKQLQVLGQATTDDEGGYRIAELRPGAYFLLFEASSRGWRNYHGLQRRNQVEQGYGSQFYPGVSERASATAIEIRSGTDAHISQTISRQRLYQVTGIVRGVDAQSGVGLMLTNEDGDAVQKETHFDARTGQFQIPGIPAGTYLLSASSWPRQGGGTSTAESKNAKLPIHVGADVTGLVLTLGRGISLGVVVRDETLNDAANNVHRAYVQLTSKEFSHNSQGAVMPPQDGGPRRIEGLIPGTYLVEARPMQQGYVAALQCGSVNLLRDDLTIAPGGAPPPIEVTLRDDGAKLEIAVMGSGEPAGEMVVVYSEDAPRRSLLMRTNGGNSVSMDNLAPGRYDVFAVKMGRELEIFDPAAVEPYLDKARIVTLGPNDKSSVRVEMQEDKAQAQ